MTTEAIRELGMLVVSRDMTIRKIANKTGFSKTNVHFNLMKLRDIDYDLFFAVRTRLEQHNKLKHIKGGEATRRKYARNKSKQRWCGRKY